MFKRSLLFWSWSNLNESKRLGYNLPFNKNFNFPPENILPHCDTLSLVTCRSLNVNASTFLNGFQLLLLTRFPFSIAKKKFENYVLPFKKVQVKKVCDYFQIGWFNSCAVVPIWKYNKVLLYRYMYVCL